MTRLARIIILSGVAVLILGGVLFYAQPKAQEDHDNMDQATPGHSLDLAIEPASYDFGTISMKNGLVTKSFKVKNQQGQLVRLAKLYTSCMCTSAKIRIGPDEYGPFGMLGGHGGTGSTSLKQSLYAGQEAELLVTFDPNAHGPAGVGVIERSVTLESDKGEITSVNIKANVVP